MLNRFAQVTQPAQVIGTRARQLAMTVVYFTVPLAFLGGGEWTLRAFADTPDSATAPTSLAETTIAVRAGDPLTLTLAPAGGYAAELSPRR